MRLLFWTRAAPAAAAAAADDEAFQARLRELV